jgi:hypothetical protein
VWAVIRFELRNKRHASIPIHHVVGIVSSNMSSPARYQIPRTVPVRLLASQKSVILDLATQAVTALKILNSPDGDVALQPDGRFWIP